MEFALEMEMIPIIKSQYETLLNKEVDSLIAVAEELPVNHRIVDLLFAPIHADTNTLNNNNYKRSLKKLNTSQLDVLAIFMTHQKGISIQRLSKILRMKPEKIKDSYLNRFLELELVQQISKYTYSSTGWSTVSPTYVVAIEAKLVKWQEALDQAVYNLNFADYSYVAMDQGVQFKPEMVQKFMDANIGLMSVSANSTVTILFEPKKNKSYKYSDFRLQRLRLCRDLICQNSKWGFIQ